MSGITDNPTQEHVALMVMHAHTTRWSKDPSFVYDQTSEALSNSLLYIHGLKIEDICEEFSIPHFS